MIYLEAGALHKPQETRHPARVAYRIDWSEWCDWDQSLDCNCLAVSVF